MKINPELQAVFNKRLDGCDSYTLDLSIGCSHNCIYCHFSQYQKTVYKKMNRDYKGNTIVLGIDDLLATTEFPEKIYFSYSTDAFAPKVRETAHRVIEHILKSGSTILLITKGIIPDHTIEMLDKYGDNVSVEIGISNLDETRRKIIEPGTPTAQKRLEMMSKLTKTKIAYLAARIDPIFPLIDDTEEKLTELLNAIAITGMRNVVASYIVATDHMIEKLKAYDYLKESLELVCEKTNTVAPYPLYSAPLVHKAKKIAFLRELAMQRGLAIHTCHCKDGRLKKIDKSHSCHPGDGKQFKSNPLNTSDLSHFERV